MRVFTTTPSRLREHIKNKHEGVRYPCVKCEYAATSIITLNNRIKN